MRNPRERLLDILEAISNIERYALRGWEAFDRDELIQNWIIRHLQIIGEAARSLPQDVRDRATGIAWYKIVGMRHILVHNYFGIDKDVVWDVVEHDLPQIKQEIKILLEKLE